MNGHTLDDTTRIVTASGVVACRICKRLADRRYGYGCNRQRKRPQQELAS